LTIIGLANTVPPVTPKPNNHETMSEPTLIREPTHGHVPPALAGRDKAVLDEFYGRYGVADKSAQEKNQVLMKVIQSRSFFAFGGGETDEMELRANERIYLSEHGKRI
jgi:hypothetical protein